jgi:hypothetical protein
MVIVLVPKRTPFSAYQRILVPPPTLISRR